MADTQDKQIKIKITTDDPGVYKFTSAMNSMNAAAEKLAQTLDKVTRSLEGFSKAQGKSSGKPNVGPTPTGKGKAGGIAETIIGGSDGSAVQNAARATERALGTTADNIKKFVDKAIQDMGRLNSALKGVGTTSYGGGGWTSTGGPGGFGGGGGGRNYGDFGSFRDEMGGIEPPSSPRKRKGGGGGSFWGADGAAGYFEGRGEALGRLLGLPPGATKMLGQGGHFIGANVGPVGGLAMAGLYAYHKASEAFEDTRMQRINYFQDEPFMKRRAATAGLNIFRSQFNAIQGGDLSQMMAYQKVMGSQDVMGALKSTQLDKEKILDTLKDPSTVYTLKSLYKGGKDRIQSWAANQFEDFQTGARATATWVSSKWDGRDLGSLQQLMASELAQRELPERYRLSLLEIAGQQAKEGLTTKKASQLQEAIGFEMMAQDPRLMTVMNRINSGSMGRLQAARMAGRGVGFDKKTGRLKYEDWVSGLTRGGWTEGDEGAGHQQLLQLGAGLSKVIGWKTLVSTSMAGLGNAGQVAQLGGILGGGVGAAGETYKALQKSVGLGGLDVAVGRELFGGMLGRMAQSGGWGEGNTALTAINMAASLVGLVDSKGHPTNDVSQQQRMMNIVMSGDQALGGFTKGTAAPIYNAMSLINAMKAMGGKYSIGVENLRAMDPSTIMAIANGGDIPEYFKGQGITSGAARAFMKAHDMTALSGFSDTNMLRLDDESRELVNRIRTAEGKGGSYIDIIMEDTEKMDPKAKGEYAKKISQRLAGLIWTTHQDKSLDSLTGVFLNPLMKTGLFGKRVDGKGVGVASPAGFEKLSLEELSKRYEEEGGVVPQGASKEFLVKALTSQVAHQDAQRMSIEAMRGSVAGDLDSVTNGLITAIQAYSNWMKNHSGSASAGAPQKAKPKGTRKLTESPEIRVL